MSLRLFVFISIMWVGAHAAIVTVPCCEVSDIAAAVSSAGSGDTVQLSTGTYLRCQTMLITNYSLTIDGQGATIDCRNNVTSRLFMSVSFNATRQSLLLQNVQILNYMNSNLLSISGPLGSAGNVTLSGVTIWSGGGSTRTKTVVAAVNVNVNLLRVVVKDNYAQSAFDVVNGNVTIAGCTFTNNTMMATTSNGGIFSIGNLNSYNWRLSVSDSQFIRNIAAKSDGLFGGSCNCFFLFSNTSFYGYPKGGESIVLANLCNTGGSVDRVFITGFGSTSNYVFGPALPFNGAGNGYTLTNSIVAYNNASIFASHKIVSNITAYGNYRATGKSFLFQRQNSQQFDKIRFFNNYGYVATNGGNSLSNLWMDNNYAPSGLIYTFSINSGKFTNVTFTNNVVSSVMVPDGGAPFVLSNAIFADNTYDTWVVSGNTLNQWSFSNVSFTNNAGNGAMIQVAGGTLTVTGTTFRQNRNIDNGGCMNIYQTTTVFQNVNFHSNSAASGGALFITDSARVTMSNCSFVNNSAGSGGAISILRLVSMTINGTTFCANIATSNGAAIYIDQSTLVAGSGRIRDVSTFMNHTSGASGTIYVGVSVQAVIIGATFGNNKANSGGAIYTAGSSVTLSGSSFIGHSATVDGGVLLLNGNAVITGCKFTGNVGLNGGCIAQKQGVLRVNTTAFAQNKGTNGGVFYGSASSQAFLYNVSMTSNRAVSSGGAGFWFASTALTCYGSVIADNIAGGVGGGLAINFNSPATLVGVTLRNNTAGTTGGGLDAATSAQVTITNATISENRAVSGAGVSSAGSTSLVGYLLSVRQNVASANGGGIYALGTVRLTGAVISNNMADIGGGIFSTSVFTASADTLIAANNASNRGGGLFSSGAIHLPPGSQVSLNTARRGAGISCLGCFLNLTGTVLSYNNATTRGAAVFCDPTAVTTPRANTPGVQLVGNYAGSEPALEANCTACGCCYYGPTVSITTALRCVQFAGISNCSYTCAVGYRVAAAYGGQVMCPASGSLDPSIICEPVACDPLPPLLNGAISYNGAPETPHTASYNCSAGYSFDGTAVQNPQCVGPDWLPVDNAPTCLPLPCADLSEPTHGSVTNRSGRHNDTVVFTCDRGYFISSSTITNGQALNVTTFAMTCITGAWTFTQPSCIGGVCPDLTDPVHGSFVARGKTTDFYVDYTCAAGYTLVGSARVFCVAPAWNDSTPTCEPIPCPSLAQPVNGMLVTTGDGTTGASAVYTCLPGFAVVGPQFLQCVGPQWLTSSQQQPLNQTTCQPIVCSGLQLPLDTSPTCYASMAYGQECDVACVPGYQGPRYHVRCSQTDDPTAIVGFLKVNTSLVPAPCAICDAGRYSADGGKCQDCPNGVTFYRGARNVSECLCVAGFYENEPGSGVCIDCPVGGLCLGKREPPVANLGYFYSGGSYVTCYPRDACQPNNTCARGYAGYACGLCQDGFYKLNGACPECPANGYWKVLVAALGAGFALLFLIPFAMPSSNSEFAIGFGSVNIVLNFIQITAIFIDIRLPWPQQIRDFMATFSALNLNIELINPECAAKLTFYDKYLLQLLLPIGVLVWFGLVALCRILWFAAWTCAKRPQIVSRARSVGLDTLGGYFSFLSLAYILVARASLSLFSCKAQVDGIYVLSLSQGDACFSDEWYKYVPVAIIAIIIYIFGIPSLFLGAALWMRARHGVTAAAANQPTSFFIKKYEPRAWYWECIIMLRKVAVVIISLFLVDRLISAVILISAVLFLSVIATAVLQPYQWDGHDMVDFIGLLGCLAVLFAGLVINSPSFSAVAVADTVAVVLVFLTLIVCVLCFIYELTLTVASFKSARSMSSPVFKSQASANALVGISVCNGEIGVAARDGTFVAYASESFEKTSARSDVQAGIASAASDATVQGFVDGDGHLHVVTGKESSSALNDGPYVAVACHDRFVVAATEAGEVRLWEVAGGSSGSSSDTATRSASRSGSLSSDEYSDKAQLKHRWDYKAPEEIGQQCVAIAALGAVIVTESFSVVQLDLEHGDAYDSWHITPTHEKERPCVVLSLASRVIVGSTQGPVYVLNTNSGSVVHLSLHTAAITALASWRGHVLSASLDGTARVWSLETNTGVFTYRAPLLGFSSMCVRDDTLVLGTESGLLLVYRLTPVEDVLRVFTPVSRSLWQGRRFCRLKRREEPALQRLLAPIDVLEEVFESQVAALQHHDAATQRQALSVLLENMDVKTYATKPASPSEDSADSSK